MSMVKDELERAVAQASAGDRSALGRVVELIRPSVLRYCRARIGLGERGFVSADDVTQEVCLAVITALPRYRDQGRPFMAFVYGIAAHKVADAHRSTGRDRSDAYEFVPDESDLESGPEERFIEDESTHRMGRILSILGERAREIVILRVVVGLSAEETAAAVGTTPGAVRVAQHRAMNKLKEHIARGGAA